MASAGNPHGRQVERHFVASAYHKVLFSGVAPSRERRGQTRTNFKVMVRAVAPKAIEGDVAAFREVMEGTREFGIGMESQFQTRKLSLELKNHLMASRRKSSRGLETILLDRRACGASHPQVQAYPWT